MFKGIISLINNYSKAHLAEEGTKMVYCTAPKPMLLLLFAAVVIYVWPLVLLI